MFQTITRLVDWYKQLQRDAHRVEDTEATSPSLAERIETCLWRVKAIAKQACVPVTDEPIRLRVKNRDLYVAAMESNIARVMAICECALTEAEYRDAAASLMMDASEQPFLQWSGVPGYGMTVAGLFILDALTPEMFRDLCELVVEEAIQFEEQYLPYTEWYVR